jgi:hypothetical protein
MFSLCMDIKKSINEDVSVKYDRNKFDFFKYVMRNLSANGPE